jgi:hypothetical protein
MMSLRTRPVAIAVLALLAGGALRADDRDPRGYGGSSRVNREDMALMARAFPRTFAIEAESARARDRYSSSPTLPRPQALPQPQPRRTTASYYPNMRSGQATRPHCTPSRVSLAGVR